MNSTPVRILVHATVTAVALVAVGVMLSELAGTYAAARSDARGGASTDGQAVTETLRWRLPLTMAGWGVAFVVVGEGLMSLWRSPKKPAEPKADPMALAEAEIQKILAEADVGRSPPTPA